MEKSLADPTTSTKKEILDASRKLFYEKGYRQTSFKDICQIAHVYRGTIYYYYKEKSILRRDVMMEHFMGCLRLAERFCEDKRYSAFLAHYIQWYKFLHDPKTRLFMIEYYEDEPVYQEGLGLSDFYATVYKMAYSPFIDTESINPLSFASVYGYLSGMIQLINVNPSAYTAEKIFFECLTSITRILDIDNDCVEKIVSFLIPCIQMLPKDQIDLNSF